MSLCGNRRLNMHHSRSKQLEENPPGWWRGGDWTNYSRQYSKRAELTSSSTGVHRRAGRGTEKSRRKETRKDVPTSSQLVWRLATMIEPFKWRMRITKAAAAVIRSLSITCCLMAVTSFAPLRSASLLTSDILLRSASLAPHHSQPRAPPRSCLERRTELSCCCCNSRAKYLMIINSSN